MTTDVTIFDRKKSEAKQVVSEFNLGDNAEHSPQNKMQKIALHVDVEEPKEIRQTELNTNQFYGHKVLDQEC
jgi:hypothetical protein